MSKLYSSRDIIRVLQKKGFFYVSQRGSHAKFEKNKLIVIVPSPKKEIPYGTFKSILRQSNLTEGDFKKG